MFDQSAGTIQSQPAADGRADWLRRVAAVDLCCRLLQHLVSLAVVH